MSLQRRVLTASIEAILFRGPAPVFNDLVAVYSDVLSGDKTALSRVGGVLRKHTNMDILVEFHPAIGYGAFIWLPSVDPNAVVDVDFGYHRSGDVGERVPFPKEYIDLIHNQKGFTDSHGKVSGVFTKIKTAMYVGTALFEGQFTAEELAAITLHEAGHLYSCFATMGRTIATSFLLDETMQALRSTQDMEKRVHAVEDLAKILLIEGLDAQTLAAPGEEETCQYVLIRDVIAKLTSDQGEARLFSGETEFMADSYATRMGAGKSLASALGKLYKLGNHQQTKSFQENLLARGLMAAVAAVAALHPASLVIGGFIASMLLVAGRNEVLERNTPVERLESIHHDLVSILKDRLLPTEMAEELVQEVKFVSALRADMVDRQSISSLIWSTLTPHYRRLYQQKELQRQIGKLVHNDLFVKAAELRTLNKKSR